MADRRVPGLSSCQVKRGQTVGPDLGHENENWGTHNSVVRVIDFDAVIKSWKLSYGK